MLLNKEQVSLENPDVVIIPKVTFEESIRIFANPMMRNAQISFTLEQESYVAIVIRSRSSSQEIRHILKAPGTSGGKRGQNQITWDGKDMRGIKVPTGKYDLQMFINGDLIKRVINISF